VREAKILKIASHYNTEQQSKLPFHALSETDAATFRDTPKLPWTEQIIKKM